MQGAVLGQIGVVFLLAVLATRGRHAANRRPRFEPRDRWPRGSPCARPWALVKGKPGVLLELDIEFLDGRRHLPIVRVKRAA